MKVTVVSREITDTVEEFEVPTPSLYKVDSNKYLYFSDKSKEIVLEFTVDEDEFYGFFVNMSQVNFLETSVACNTYKIHTLTPCEEDVSDLLEIIINKFKSFL